jgi:PAS domain S-box-containing protein
MVVDRGGRFPVADSAWAREPQDAGADRFRFPSALLLSQQATGERTIDEILREAAETISTLVPCAAAGVYVREDATGGFRLAGLRVVDEAAVRAKDEIEDVPAELATPSLLTTPEPSTLEVDALRRIPRSIWISRDPRPVLVVPLQGGSERFGALVVVSRAADEGFDDRTVELARTVTNIASLALGNARRLAELERFHELVASLDAVFWEADASSLAFTFLGGRVDDMLGAGASTWPDRGFRWGDHVAEEDRAVTLAACLSTIERGQERSLDYRIEHPDGRALWVRDAVHVVRDARGPRELRGVMVDITERKRAEQALRTSERQYSEAFRREREATQRLRALDEMKNTFLEAVSHDLRTPLTSILGSALTLESSELALPRDDALDLIGRIAANARKLERLLGDLLDLDRLQRGIVAPQRRPTDLAALVARAVDEIDDPSTHVVVTDVAPGTYHLDAAKVERIVENLLSNALRHTPSRTPVWIRTEPADGGVTIIVEDAGPGVPEELRDAVFEPFRQAPGSSSGHSPGVGIGLSLVRRFAELHGGKAWLEPRPGGGASFRVFLSETGRAED